MNLQHVNQREVLEFKDFLKKVHDYNYKPLSPANQSQGGLDKSGMSKITREPAFDYAGYADSVFGKSSKIDVPGGRIRTGNAEYGTIDATTVGSVFNMNTSESVNFSHLKRLEDF